MNSRLIGIENRTERSDSMSGCRYRPRPSGTKGAESSEPIGLRCDLLSRVPDRHRMCIRPYRKARKIRTAAGFV